MNTGSIKSFAARLSLATVAAGALLFAGTAPAQAQQWGVDVRLGAPAYAVDRDVYYRDYAAREYYARQRAEREAYERRQREEFLRRQAWLRHERWEREHRFYDRDRDFDRYR